MAMPCTCDEGRSRRKAVMTVRRALAACCIVVCVGGCRAVDNAQADVMERELRRQEDYIYELEDYLREYSDKLRECRTCQPIMAVEAPASTQVRTSEPTLANDTPEPSPPRNRGSRSSQPLENHDATRSTPDALPAGSATEPAPPSAPATAPAAAPVNPEDLDAPPLEIGPTGKLDRQDPTPIATSPQGDEAPLFIPDPANYQVDVERTSASAQGTTDANESSNALSTVAIEEPNTTVAETAPELAAANPMLPPEANPARLTAEKLQIRQILDKPGDDGDSSPRSLLVVIEALNGTDEPVDAPGEASLMVTTGETKDSLKLINRWDFTAEETKAAWQSSQLGDGLHLELPLGDKPLPDGKLELWARLVNAEGKKLLTRVSFVGSDLAPLEMAMEPDSVTPPEAGGDLQATDAAMSAAADDSSVELAASAQPAPSAPKTLWRASTRSAGIDRIEASATSTAGKATTGWTRQPPGSRSATAGPGPLAAPAGPPRWQQGSAVAKPHEPSAAWEPFR